MTRIQEIAEIDGFGESAKVIREEIDPLWGIATGNEKQYRIAATVTNTEDVSIDVIADNPKEAKEEAIKEIADSYFGDIEVDYVIEIKPEIKSN